MAPSASTRPSGLVAKLYEINWLLPVLTGLLGLVGVLMIYAATGGVWGDGAYQHFMRIGFAGLIMIGIAVTDIKIWYNLAYPVYGLALLLLIGVELIGVNAVSYTHLTLPTTSRV